MYVYMYVLYTLSGLGICAVLCSRGDTLIPDLFAFFIFIFIFICILEGKTEKLCKNYWLILSFTLPLIYSTHSLTVF